LLPDAIMPASVIEGVPAAMICDAVRFENEGVAAAELTVMPPDVPVIEAVTVSVAVIVCDPAVFSVAENVSTPFVSVELAGNTAAASLLVKCTVPV
jgi:hypothetical protein